MTDILSKEELKASILTTTTSTTTNNNIRKTKPLVPPKPKLLVTSSAAPADTNSSECSNSCDTQMNKSLNYNSIIASLKEKMSKAYEQTDDQLENEFSFSLLDEIYAEIEDKQIKSSIKPIETAIQEKSLPIKYCASLSCSSSSYTSASSAHSTNSCICYSKRDSVLITAPPPLPSMPPPPLTPAPTPTSQRPKSRSSSVLSRHSAVLSEPLSLEQEIEMEIRNKFCLLLKSSPETDLDSPMRETADNLDSIADQLNDFKEDELISNGDDMLETDYLEPINLVNSNYVEKQSSNRKTEATGNAQSSYMLSPSYRLKSYFQAKLKENSISMDKNSRTSLNYLIKQSNKISSTLKFIRTKSTSNEQAASTDTSSASSTHTAQNLIETTLNSFKRQQNKKRSTSSNSQHTTHSAASQPSAAVCISGPTLISQTFDLKNKNLIEIVQSVETNNNNNNSNMEDNESFSTTSSFSSSSTSSCNRIEMVYQAAQSWSSDESCHLVLQNGSNNVYEEQLEIINDANSNQSGPTTSNKPIYAASNNNITKSSSSSSLNNNSNSPSPSISNPPKADISFQEKKKALGQLFGQSNASPPAVQPVAPVATAAAAPPPPPQSTKPYQNNTNSSNNINSNNHHTGSNNNNDYQALAAVPGQIKKPAPPTPPPRNDIIDSSLKPNLNNNIKPPMPGQPKPTLQTQLSNTSNSPLNYKPQQAPPPPPPPPPLSVQNNSKPPPPLTAPPPPPPNPPPPLPSHRPVPPIPPNSQPIPNVRPAPRAPPQPPVTKPAANNSLVDDLERRFHFLPFPNTPDIPKTFAPPNNRQYPSSKYNEKIRANRS